MYLLVLYLGYMRQDNLAVKFLVVSEQIYIRSPLFHSLLVEGLSKLRLAVQFRLGLVRMRYNCADVRIRGSMMTIAVDARESSIDSKYSAQV